MLVDLENVDNPQGRVDVAAYKLLGVAAKKLEEKYNMQGAWDIVKPHVGTLVNQYLGDIVIPVEAELIMKLFTLGQLRQQQVQQREG